MACIASQNDRTIFVTVGTTLFEPLIECVTSPLFLNDIALNGYNRLIIQYGKGVIPIIGNDTGDGDGNTRKSSIQKSQGDKGQRKGVYITTSYPEEQKGDKDGCAPLPSTKIHWEIYDFKPSLAEDMDNADLIISHAGAGSIMEGLDYCNRRNSSRQGNESAQMKKKLVVVINDRLMDNHQCELAYALEKRNYLYVLSKPDMLKESEVLSNISSIFQPKNFEGGNDSTFGRLIDDFMGYSRID